MEEVINVGMNRINKTPAAVKVTANGSLKGNKKSKHASESVARFIFLICAVVAILAVCSITIYMFIKGTESLKSVGIADLLFKTVWAPGYTTCIWNCIHNSFFNCRNNTCDSYRCSNWIINSSFFDRDSREKTCSSSSAGG